MEHHISNEDGDDDNTCNLSTGMSATSPPGFSPSSFRESPILHSTVKAEPSSTTVSLFKYHQMHQSSTESEFSFPTRNTSSHISDDGFELQVQAGVGSASGLISTTPSNCTGLKQCQREKVRQEYNQYLSRSVVPVTLSKSEMSAPNKSGQSVHVSMHASLVNAASASEPEEITLKDQQSGCNQVPHSDPRNSISSSTTERSLVDGYNWRKYGEKLVKGSEFPRSYYKCTYPNCEVKKIFESSPDGHIAYIVYKGSHDHPIPQPRRRFIPGTRTSIQEEKNHKDSYFNGQEDKFNRNVSTSSSPPGFSPTSFLESPLLHSNIKAEPSPTTDSLFKYHQMHQSSTEAEFSFPTSSHISDYGFEFQVQAGAGSASGFTSTPPSNCTGLKQFQREKVRQEYNQCLSRSVVPVTLSKSEMSSPNKSGQSVHVSKHASLVNAASASEPEEITKKDQQSGCNRVSHSDPRSAISSSTAEISLVDGYNWRKYGEKLVKGSEFPRSYYKCTYPNCEVKKIFESSPDGHIAYIVYKGSHDHPIPQPRRRFIPGTRTSIQAEKNRKDSYFNGQEDKFNRNVTTSSSPPGFSPTSFLESPLLHSNIKAEPSPTTDSLFKYHQMHRSSTEAEFSFPTSNTSSHISDDGFECQVQAGAGSASGFTSTPPSNCTGLKQFQREKVKQEYNQCLSRSVVPVTLSKSEMSSPNKSGQSVHVSMDASLVNAASASEPEEITKKDQQSSCNQVSHSDPRSAISSSTDEISLVDGYNWRKYGEKLVKGSEFPRSYYKCTYPNCEVKKIFESSPDGHIAYIVYKGSHDHPIPQPRRRFIPGIRTSIQEEKIDEDSYFNGQEDMFNRNGLPSRSDPNGMNVISPRQVVEDSPEGASDEIDKEYPFSKKRKIDGSVYITAVSKPIREPRVVVQTLSEVEILDDGYRWRKYGQKVVRGNPNPRSYYKCIYAKCSVRKHVERASHDPKAVITTYEGKHSHDLPTARSSNHELSWSPPINGTH